MFSSSASVGANDLVILTDDKEWQTAENVLPALNSKAAIFSCCGTCCRPGPANLQAVLVHHGAAKHARKPYACAL